MEENNVTVTEMNTDGSVDVYDVPAEQFDATNYVPSEESKTGIGGILIGAAALVGAGTAMYGAYKGIRKLCRIVKAGIEAVRAEDAEEDVLVDDPECEEESVVIDDNPEVRDFVDKRKEETKSKGK